MDSKVATINQIEPYLVITGRPGEVVSQTFVCCEKWVFVTSRSVQDDLMDLMAVDFMFDVTFPSCCSSSIMCSSLLMSSHCHLPH